MTRNWRTHQFAPLSGAGRAPAQSAVDGYQQGLERGYSEGLEQGLQEGLQRGLVEGRDQAVAAAQAESRARFADLVAPIEAIYDKLSALELDFETALRKEVVELVIQVAREVVRCELTVKPVQLLAMVEEAVGTLPRAAKRRIEVYVNAADLERLTRADRTRTARWNLIADPLLMPGECRIKSGDRELDAGCRGRLAACAEQVTQQLLGEARDIEVAA